MYDPEADILIFVVPLPELQTSGVPSGIDKTQPVTNPAPRSHLAHLNCAVAYL
jgi:hypothetical protein